MPIYTPTTPTLTLCDNLVDSLEADWLPAAPDGAERAYFKRIADSEDQRNKLTGRRVMIFPTGYDYSPATRREDQYTHHVSVLTVERYAGAGDPPRDWTDERVDFVYTHVVQGFDWDHRINSFASFSRLLVTDSSEVQVCDIEKLTSGGRLFYSLVNIVFFELINA